MGTETDLIVKTAPLVLLVAFLTGTVGAFTVSPNVRYAGQNAQQIPRHPHSKMSAGNSQRRTGKRALNLASSDDDDEQSQKDRLAALGYTDTEISRSKTSGDDPTTRPGEQEVFVDEFEVDAATLTAVGFGLIALNFFVFANLGDVGIGGFVASLINSRRY